MKRKRKNSTVIISDENSLNSCIKRDKDVMHKSPRKISRQSIKKSLHNSVIIINDSESESSDQDKADSSVIILGCGSDTSKTPVQHSRVLRSQKNQFKQLKSIPKRKSAQIASEEVEEHFKARSNDAILIHNNLPTSSNTQISLENKDKNRANTEDDVVELWSCLDKPSNKNKEVSKENKNDQTKECSFMILDKPSNKNKEVSKENKNDQTKECSFMILDKSSNKNKEVSKENKNDQTKECSFTIDTQPDLKNLEYIKLDASPVCKKLKVWHYFNKGPSTNKFNKHMTQKLLNKRQKTKTSNKLNIPFSNNNIKKSIKKVNQDNEEHKELREIVVDGCNVAMAHTNGRAFSEKGILIIVDYFQLRGHVVKVFLPQHVRRKEFQLIEKMYTDGIVVFTPSRNIAGRQITSYDDRYILEYATKCGGIVISSDQYRDLYKEKPEWRETIVNRLLIPTFVGDLVMFPEDPLGRFGPNLERFLRF